MLFGGNKSKKVVEYDKVEGEILRIGSSLCSGGYSDNETNFHFILAGSPDIYYIQKVDVELVMKFSLTKEGDRISFMTESGAMSYKRIVEGESIEFISLNELLKLQSD